MIKKLQIKFMVIIMSIMAVVIFGIFVTINLTMYQSTHLQSINMMKRIAENDGLIKNAGKLNPIKTVDSGSESDFAPIPQINFSIKLDKDGQIIEVISDRTQNYTQQEVTEYLKHAQAFQKATGTAGGLKFLIAQKPYGEIIVFLDNSMQASATIRLFWVTLFVGLASLVVIFFISLHLSSWAIKPVKDAYEAQKRFVADASHELKTPLTIISANADVLSGEIGTNKWLGFIKTESLRMGELVNNLLYLAKSDASENTYQMVEFDLSDAIISTILPFESSCYESRKQLVLDIPPQITITGDRQRLMQVLIILLDNALKNTTDQAEIKISLALQNSKKMISVYNTGDGLSKEDENKIFDRFYRGDSSRARQTGGYGLGLSIAKTIVDAHKGKISVENQPGQGVKFTVTL